METVKLHWNFIDKKWNLVEIGTVIPTENYGRSYVIPAEAHFIDPRKSRLVRLAYKLHLFYRKLNPKKLKPQRLNKDLSVFKNLDLGEKWDIE